MDNKCLLKEIAFGKKMTVSLNHKNGRFPVRINVRYLVYKNSKRVAQVMFNILWYKSLTTTQ